MARQKVTKEEFNNFISNYPSQLETHVSMICQPPVRAYHKPFSEPSDFPKSIVATVVLNSAMRGYPGMTEEKLQDEYYIIKE